MPNKLCHYCFQYKELNLDNFRLDTKMNRKNYPIPICGYKCKVCQSLERTNKNFSKSLKRRLENREKINIKQNSERQERLLLGQCFYCKNKRLPNSTSYCEQHFLESKAKKHLKSSKYWINLKQILEKQNSKCPYTGELIVLGLNDALDHIIPRQGQKVYDRLDNLQFVLRDVNLLKFVLDEHRFLELCTKIH